MSTSSPDRWLLPRRQTEFPLRDLLPEEILHARREATFLVLAMFAVVPVVMLVLLGASHVIDLSAVLAQIGLDSSTALALPVGVAPFAISLVAVAIVCELFGRRRARALVWVASMAALGLAVFVRLVDAVDGGEAFAAALALAAACVVAHVVHVIVFDGLRRAMHGRARFVRLIIAGCVACAIGFAAFLGIESLGAGPGVDATAIAAGSALWSCALAIVLAIVAVAIMRGLSIALRVGREMVVQRDVVRERVIEPPALPTFVPPPPVVAAPAPAAAIYERSARGTPAIGIDRAPRTTLQGFAKNGESRRLPAAQIVDEDAVALEPSEVVVLEPKAPFSSAEMQFFREGDEL